MNEHYFLILRMKLGDNGFSADRSFNRDSGKNKSRNCQQGIKKVFFKRIKYNSHMWIEK